MGSSGFILIDSSFHPVYADPESLKILGYPNKITDPGSMGVILRQKILSFLPRTLPHSKVVSVTQFQSGRRRYTCRAFVLEDHWSLDPRQFKIAILLERGLAGSPRRSSQFRKYGGMCEDPFGFSPDPRYYYMSRAHHEVFQALRTMVLENRGIGVLSAQAGMGKTTLINYLVENLHGDTEIVVVPGSFESRAEFLRAVMGLLGVESRGTDVWDNLKSFRSWLAAKNEAGRKVLLICDEAQDLNLDTLENLCRLSELEMNEDRKLIQVVLAGRQGLIEKLTGLRLAPVSRGIHICCRLIPLDETEVRNYVLHRLSVAGCTRQIFSTEALSSIAMYSRGIPLNINMLCRHSLSVASTIDMRQIDKRIVEDSAFDLVLRSQPANVLLNPFRGPKMEPDPPDRWLGGRRGLRLIKKN